MASEDVIELGSSDDEASPPTPRRVAPAVATSAPKLNAMVHIPKKIHGVTIKPTKACSAPMKVNNKLITKPAQTGSNVKYTMPIKVKDSQMPKHAFPKLVPKTVPFKPMAIPINTSALNPMSIMKTFDKSQIVINKVSVPTGNNIPNLKLPLRVGKPPGQGLVRNPMVKLPASVTVTKTYAGNKRPLISNVTSLKKKQKIASPSQLPKIAPKLALQNSLLVNPLASIGEILTVELDDEVESSPSTSNPQWYLRPEQLGDETKELEELNNKEPEKPSFIEICIEDSPVSKPKNKGASEIGNSITIEDSPTRHISTPKKATSGSESEGDGQKHKTPKKRKRLEYPAEVSMLETPIEIEIEPMEVDPINTESEKDTDVNEAEPKACEPKAKKIEATKVDESVIEIFESPVKKKKIRAIRAINVEKQNESILDKKQPNAVLQPVTEDREFHPVYQSFINLCFELDNSNDMKTIVEKKIKGYYKQVPKEYTESEEFIDMVSSKILSMKAGKEKMYLYIKDIVDELNVQRKMVKAQSLSKEAERKESGKLIFADDSEFDAKRQRQIRKLEKTIQKLHRAIQKLEEQEVDFEDEEDSVYLLTERYKERMVRVHAKLCQLTNTKLPSEPRLNIDSRPGQPTGPAKRLEKWINKKVPMGKPLPFPDFHDVLRIVREANLEDKLGWNEADIMEEARDLFTRCGKKLQRRRQEIEWRIAASRLPVDVDPAEDNEDLKTKLERNRLLASKKETDVFNKYAERQSEMKLEGEEIGDKEAEESPAESEDDDVTELTDEASALGDKERRKERLKRLIQEKSQRKSSGETNSQPDEQENSAVQMSVDTHMIDDKDPLESLPVTNETGKDQTEQKDEETGKVGAPEKKDSNSENGAEGNPIDLDDGSETDELHLLKKLYSESENNGSAADSSDSDTPIDISDTVDSDDPKGNDIISIENSSDSDTPDSNAKDNISSETKSPQVIEEIQSSNDAPTEPLKNDDENELSLNVQSPQASNDDKDDGGLTEITPSNPTPINDSEQQESTENKECETLESITASVENMLSNSQIDEKINEIVSVNSLLPTESDQASTDAEKQVESQVSENECVTPKEDVIPLINTVVEEAVNEENDNKKTESDAVVSDSLIEKDDFVSKECSNSIETMVSISTRDFATTDLVNNGDSEVIANDNNDSNANRKAESLKGHTLELEILP